jgi:anti-anti-sigma regulatory factor
VTHLEQKQLSDSSLHVAISGKIDETFDGTPVLAVKNAPKVVLHLGGIRSISSLGVRAFEAFIAALGKREVVLIHVSAAVASQLTMIPNLCQGARVESAKLPFACPACGTEKLHSVPWRREAASRFAPVCTCGAQMALDGLPEQYLP